MDVAMFNKMKSSYLEQYNKKVLEPMHSNKLNQQNSIQEKENLIGIDERNLNKKRNNSKTTRGVVKASKINLENIKPMSKERTDKLGLCDTSLTKTKSKQPLGDVTQNINNDSFNESLSKSKSKNFFCNKTLTKTIKDRSKLIQTNDLKETTKPQAKTQSGINGTNTSENFLVSDSGRMSETVLNTNLEEMATKICETSSGEQANENSFKTSQPRRSSKRAKINMESLIRIEEILFSLVRESVENKFFFHTLCADYNECVKGGEIEDLDLLFRDQNHEKLIRKSVLLERMAVLMNISSEYWEKDYNIIHKILKVCHNSLSLILLLIIRKVETMHNDNISKNEWVKKLRKMVAKKGENVSDEEILSFIGDNTRRVSRHVEFLLREQRENFKEKIQEFIQKLDTFTIKTGYQFLLSVFEIKYRRGLRADLSLSDREILRPQPPFLSEKASDAPSFTLIIDLDETLVHYFELHEGGQFLIRPFTQEFLKEMSEHYEIVVFTSAMQDYADWVLDKIDKHSYISHRLYRHHTIHFENTFIKDISMIGRELSKTIIIDNISENFRLQPENGIYIRPWFCDPNDSALNELKPILKEIAVKNSSDVRVALKKIKDKITEKIMRGESNPHLNISLD